MEMLDPPDIKAINAAGCTNTVTEHRLVMYVIGSEALNLTLYIPLSASVYGDKKNFKGSIDSEAMRPTSILF